MEQRSKRRKEEEDATQKTKLVKVLAERDESIAVLRSLAAEKEGMVKLAKAMEAAPEVTDGDTKTNGNVTEQSKQSIAGTKPNVDYGLIPLERLKALEKARDATLSFLLKRIDRAEAELGPSLKGKTP